MIAPAVALLSSRRYIDGGTIEVVVGFAVAPRSGLAYSRAHKEIEWRAAPCLAHFSPRSGDGVVDSSDEVVGDANGDGLVNSGDTGIEGDTNGDGVVDDADTGVEADTNGKFVSPTTGGGMPMTVGWTASLIVSAVTTREEGNPLVRIPSSLPFLFRNR